MQRPLHFKSLLDVGDMIRRGEILSVKLTEYMLKRIEAEDPEYHSYIHLCRDHALAQAKVADAEVSAGLKKGAAAWGAHCRQGSVLHRLRANTCGHNDLQALRTTL